MSSEHEHNVQTAAAELRRVCNNMKAGNAKDAVRAASEQMIHALASAGYTLRNGVELPDVS
jgi:hypothetical protein